MIKFKDGTIDFPGAVIGYYVTSDHEKFVVVWDKVIGKKVSLNVDENKIIDWNSRISPETAKDMELHNKPKFKALNVVRITGRKKDGYGKGRIAILKEKETDIYWKVTYLNVCNTNRILAEGWDVFTEDEMIHYDTED